VEIPRAAVCNFAFVNHWIIKSEPFKYSWEQFEKDGSTFWDGVRNFQARNNLREMKVGDLCLYYHSNEGKEMVGIARVIKEHYPDPTTDDHNWVVVDVQPFQKLRKPVSLAQMKADSRLSNLGLIRQSQLSVIKISKDEFDIILSLSEN
jgi:predicted RNA-binding protein with PUA-like domain